MDRQDFSFYEMGNSANEKNKIKNSYMLLPFSTNMCNKKFEKLSILWIVQFFCLFHFIIWCNMTRGLVKIFGYVMKDLKVCASAFPYSPIKQNIAVSNLRAQPYSPRYCIIAKVLLLNNHLLQVNHTGKGRGLGRESRIYCFK